MLKGGNMKDKTVREINAIYLSELSDDLKCISVQTVSPECLVLLVVFIYGLCLPGRIM